MMGFGSWPSFSVCVRWDVVCVSAWLAKGWMIFFIIHIHDVAVFFMLMFVGWGFCFGVCGSVCALMAFFL